MLKRLKRSPIFDFTSRTNQKQKQQCGQGMSEMLSPCVQAFLCDGIIIRNSPKTRLGRTMLTSAGLYCVLQKSAGAALNIFKVKHMKV